MYQIKEEPIPRGVGFIKIENVPALSRRNVTIVRDPALSGRVVIEAEEKLRPLQISFTFSRVGDSLVAYFSRPDDGGDPSLLSAVAFTVKVPHGYKAEVV